MIKDVCYLGDAEATCSANQLASHGLLTLLISCLFSPGSIWEWVTLSSPPRREASCRRKALAAEEVCERVSQARRDAERQCRLAEQEARERAQESQSWKEKHQALAATLKAQEDLRSQRQNKAVSGPRF